MTGIKFYIETYGCQMNIYDSGVITEYLVAGGMRPVEEPEHADLVLINTCSVRDRAERKAISRLMELSALRKQNPRLRIGVLGCMAQRLGQKLIDAGGRVDLVAGPDSYGALRSMLEDLWTSPGPIVETGQDPGCLYTYRPESHEGVSAFVTIMRGCDNYCSYCVVPFVRGRERSKPGESILEEIRHLVDLGVRQVTLLGQNVNSYHDGRMDFADLLEAVDGLPGLDRIRFTTSHPKDLSPKVIDGMRDLPKVCESLHLPLQSGSNRVLKLMNRGYTCDDYKRLAETAREAVPGLALSTDLMVGFPSESLADHEATIRAMESIRFDSAFMFRYSVREGTRAAGLRDDVSELEKIRRLREVIELQNILIDEKKQALPGQEVEILVEGPSRRDPGFMVGRTRKNWLAKLPQKGVSKGETVIARVTGVTRWMIACDAAVRKVGGTK
jgi:tRNA-2-methylthio-N6-dimethylallyladenosine synthase